MGLFKKIGKIFKKAAPVLGAIAAPFTGGTSLWATLGSTALDVASNMYSNKMAQDNATTAWNRQMGASNTSYQRATADMRAAGLNPILAYSQGGASVPTAQAAATTPLEPQGSKNIANATQLAQQRSIVAQTANTQAQTVNTAVNTDLAAENVKRQRLENEGLEVVPPWMRALGQMGGGTAAAAGAAGYGASRFLTGLGTATKAAARAPITTGTRLYRAIRGQKALPPPSVHNRPPR